MQGAVDGSVALPRPADRIGGLRLLETGHGGPAGAKFLARCVGDGDGSVRQRALETVRQVGWWYDGVYGAVWALAEDAQRPMDERLAAVSVLGTEDVPDAARWRRMLEAGDPVLVRMALRTVKRFVGDDATEAMVASVAPGLTARDASLAGELSAVFELFDLAPANREALALPPPLNGMDRETIVKRVLGGLPAGDVRLGRDAFRGLGCTSCHDVTGARVMLGPALKDVGKAVTPAYIAESILFPSRVIKDGFEGEMVVLASGETLDGRVEVQGEELVIIGSGNERVRVRADQVADRRKRALSTMPEPGLVGVSIGELSDLAAYLVSQGGDPKAVQASAAGGGASKR
jgi:putative heme-binding domain-containing protein